MQCNEQISKEAETKKDEYMKQTWLFFLFTLMGLMLVACGGAPGTVSEQSGGNAETIQEKPFTLDQLVATDPDTVQLAAGKVQLIEFFAYW